MTIGQFLLFALGLYALVGVGVSFAFVTIGITKVLPTPASFTAGARLVLLPGAAALWPYVLVRWLRTRNRP
jgi:hypothetical protein